MHPLGTFAPFATRIVKATLVFGAGTAWGLLLGGALESPGPRSPRDAEVVPVKGVETAREALPPAPTASVAPPRALLETLDDGGPRRSPRALAREAVSISAWIRADGVYGAGVVVSDRHVLTCLHVVEKMREPLVSVAEGPPVRASVVDRDATLDLAILEIEGRATRHARLASAADVQMGDRVYGMGAPRKMSFSLASGIVSYAGRDYSKLYYLQTDIPTNGGSSGGPILDETGRVVAIASFILRDSQGLAFALPIDYAYGRFRRYFSPAITLDEAQFQAWLDERRARGARPTAPDRDAVPGAVPSPAREAHHALAPE